MVEHHPPDEMLASWSAGASPSGEALLVATHLALCPSCRDRSAALDAVGGAWLSDAVPANLEGGLDRLLARLDDPPPAPIQAPAPAGRDDLPMPLRALTGPLDAVPFRRKAPGVWRFDLPMSTPECAVALVSLRPRFHVPPHHHSATERGLVLSGGYTDETGHYTRGDVQVRTPDDPEPHDQRIDDGQRCVVLMVDDGAKLPTTWLGQLVVRLFERRS